MKYNLIIDGLVFPDLVHEKGKGADKVLSSLEDEAAAEGGVLRRWRGTTEYARIRWDAASVIRVVIAKR